MTTPEATLRSAMVGMLVPALLLAGCVVPLTTPGTCQLAGTQAWVGQRLTHKIERWIGDKTHARRVRVIRAGEVVTHEFRDNRANIVVDDRGLIARIYCG